MHIAPLHLVKGRPARLAIAAGLTLGLAGASVTALLATSVASASTLKVTSCTDSGPGSLRAAVAGAAPGETVQFAANCPAGPTGIPTITLTSGPIVIATDLTLEGPGAGSLAVSGGGNVPVLLTQQVTATISGLTITDGNGSSAGGASSGPPTGGGITNGGTLTLEGTNVSGNSAAGAGGGILNTGTLTLTNATVSANTVTGGTLANGGSAGGGGIMNSGTLTLTHTMLSSNTVTAGTLATGGSPPGGGGIFNTGMLTLNHSTISHDTATPGTVVGGGSLIGGDGGGILQAGGTLTIGHSAITRNIANGGTVPPAVNTGEGGGIYYFFQHNRPGHQIILNGSQVAGNTSSADGGGIFNGGVTVITGGTITGNTALGSGGGIDNGGTLTLGKDTISDNTDVTGGGAIYSGSLVGATTPPTVTAVKTSIVQANGTGLGVLVKDGTATIRDSDLAVCTAC